MAKSKYHQKTKAGKRKRFPNGGASRWLRTRHRMKKKLVRQ